MGSSASWKEANINLGLFVAIIIGAGTVILATAGAIEGARNWVDNRISLGLDPVVDRVSAIESRLDSIDSRLDSDDRRRNQQYGQIRSDICRVLEALDEECPD